MAIDVVDAPTKRLASGAWASPVNDGDPSPVPEPGARCGSATTAETKAPNRELVAMHHKNRRLVLRPVVASATLPFIPRVVAGRARAAEQCRLPERPRRQHRFRETLPLAHQLL